MPRDFRPKKTNEGQSSSKSAASRAATSEKSSSKFTAATSANRTQLASKGPRTPTSSTISKGKAARVDSDEEEDVTTLMEHIRQLGGNEEDLELVTGLGRSGGRGREAKGKSMGKDPEDAALPDLTADLRSYMKELHFKLPPTASGERGKDAPHSAQNSTKSTRSTDPERSRKAALVNSAPVPDSIADAALSASQVDKGNVQRDPKTGSDASKKRSNKDHMVVGDWKSERTAKKQSAEAAKRTHADHRAAVSSARSQRAVGEVKTQLLLPAAPRWRDAFGVLAPISAGEGHTESALKETQIATLHSDGMALLEQERITYDALSGQGGDGMGVGTLSAADSRFVRSLLSGTGATGSTQGGGGTVADRISALTLLLQSSPVHNVRSLDALLAMCGKKGREEAGRASRALADWLASDGGLGKRKLRYFRDQPALTKLASQTSTDSIGKAHLCLYAFEDLLKGRYYAFLQILEAQTQDTLPFVRKQALGHVFGLLRDAPEQEANLLRLLSNKLGDTDRSVAAKASRLLLELLTTHPAMKAVVTREVANLVLRPPQVISDSEGHTKKKHNQHARYYGILTLNQTMLTAKDTEVANRLVALYFDLFESVLIEGQSVSRGKEETVEGDAAVEKVKKARWRDSNQEKDKAHGKRRGKNGKNLENDQPSDDDTKAKMTAAILAGVRRAIPFASVDDDIFDKHMDTLFRITHSSIFNISIQALQLIYQVISTSRTSKLSPSATTAICDRFYRTLYSSLLDERLGSTSKQAMYLNLIFKALKNDDDPKRVKAFVKRLAQILANHQPPFVCGALFMLGELFKSTPGLQTMLTEPEDEGEEHFVDVADEAEQPPGLRDVVAKAAVVLHGPAYDGRKREPRFSHAEQTCLWELEPLLAHFHPTVSLLAKQLVMAQPLTSHADLSLHSLSHFLDRFVFRNPKKAAARGVSAMQPALPIQLGHGVAADPETPVIMTKGGGMGEDEYVNDSRFWRKQAGDVPVDQLFFHRYFNQKLSRQQASASSRQSTKDTAGIVALEGEDAAALSDESLAASESDEDSDIEIEGEQEFSDDDADESRPNNPQYAEEEDSGEEDENEREIWAAMKQSMPRAEGDEDLMADSESDENEMEGYSDSEGSNDAAEPASASDQESIFGDEDEDDLLPFSSFQVDGAHGGSKKRGHTQFDDDNDDAVERSSDGEHLDQKARNKERRELKRRRKAMPTFASADDYAHLLGGSDEEVES